MLNKKPKKSLQTCYRTYNKTQQLYLINQMRLSSSKYKGLVSNVLGLHNDTQTVLGS